MITTLDTTDNPHWVLNIHRSGIKATYNTIQFSQHIFGVVCVETGSVVADNLPFGRACDMAEQMNITSLAM